MSGVPVQPAASILVLDDRPDLHVLVGRRRPGSQFVGGMIVFPGGGVDPGDHGPDARAVVPSAAVPDMTEEEGAAFLHAGLRETLEEVGLWVGGGLPVDGARFPHVARWITPEDAPRRYDTHFFLARHPGGEARADQIELTDVWWERPGDVLERVASGALDAILPTLELLRSLSEYGTVEDAFGGTGTGRRRGEPTGWTSF